MERKERCVVTGIGILSSIGNHKKEVLNHMKKGLTGIGEITRFETDEFMSEMGGELKNYDPNQYFSQTEQKQYDRCAQYAIISAKEAITDSYLNLKENKRQKIGVAFGTCNGGINSIEQQGDVHHLDNEYTARYPFYQQGDDVATYFNLNGPVNTLNTACAASGNAIGFAHDMITQGYADAMLAGGADSMSSTVYAGFNVLQSLNDKPCSPYNNAFGLSLGEGSAFLVLEPLSKALERNAFIYAEICGYGLSNDSYHETAPDPEGEGIRFAASSALKHANVDKKQIGYVNTHGTGTKANDVAELNGLKKLFGEDLFSTIYFSSSKAYFGHNLGAAAVIEYVTTLLAMQEGLLPATVNFETPREGCDHDNLITNEMKKASPAYFLCNNSAFGGHNVSVVSRNWKESQSRTSTKSHEEERVVITGLGMVHGKEKIQGGALERIISSMDPVDECTFSLKEYDKSLYQRRMNRLSQFSIGAADLALKDANVVMSEKNEYKVGLVYGTSRGTLQSSEKY
ncbi:beta-ketoacyl-[acyl-carrier-protein] synthase family protein [Lentibacillus cibarius]|uniref:beta-ketoacyl-[acyl-carrier-protein] synthase family protein n=1 Tax=Lentibacillus cibarius TaxID=2583219 RepID=UPI001F46946D|nr:beta-ketoacyl-[acyl-carrier-protein] synthase family protein [Lentibacillus cibarius]